MNLLRRAFQRLTGARHKALHAENQRLKAAVQRLKAKQAMLPRRVDNARREGMSEVIMDFVLRQIGPGDTVLDCGANVGSVTEMLASTGATVHAFEPDPHALEILTRKFAGLPNVTLHPVAVGGHVGTVTFWRNRKHDDNPELSAQGNTLYASHHSVTSGDVTSIDVPMIDLAAFVQDLLDQKARIAFVKIDVEGAELDILPAMLARNQFDHIALTVAETHEFQLPDQAEAFKALRATIADRYPKHRVNLDWI